AEFRDGHLVVSQTVGLPSDSQAHAHWYDFVIPVVLTQQGKVYGAALLQEGTINPGTGVDTMYPAIAVAPNGDLGMTYMETSATEYLSVYVTGRAFGDPVGQMQTPVLLKAGVQDYVDWLTTDPNVLYGAAGDFSGISADPVACGSFWA